MTRLGLFVLLELQGFAFLLAAWWTQLGDDLAVHHVTFPLLAQIGVSLIVIACALPFLPARQVMTNKPSGARTW